MTTEAKDPAVDATEPGVAGPWHRQVDARGWHSLAGALVAFTFENFDIFLLSLTIPTFTTVFGVSKSEAGLVSSATSFGLIVGGVAAGFLADRIGRVRVLTYAIIVYAVFTGLIATTDTIVEVGLFRILSGLGIGAGWTAGATLVAESWPARHRGKGGALMQMGLPIGSLHALGTALLLSARTGNLNDGQWRTLYLVGAIPLVLAIYVRFFVPESQTWQSGRARREKSPARAAITGDGLGRLFTIAFAFVFCVQYVYYAVFTFAPTFLVDVRGLTLTKSLTYTLVQQTGSLCGFLLFGALVDRWGRRPTFTVYLVGGAIATALFVTLQNTTALYTLSFFLGMGIAGVYAGLGPWSAEMMSTSPNRATAMGLIYNGGRIGGAIAPFIVGTLATTATGFVIGMLTTLVAFAVAIAAMAISRETKGTELGS
ncbi:MAG TPA: MFS transporter [Actinocrinis sp.]